MRQHQYETITLNSLPSQILASIAKRYPQTAFAGLVMVISLQADEWQYKTDKTKNDPTVFLARSLKRTKNRPKVGINGKLVLSRMHLQDLLMLNSIGCQFRHYEQPLFRYFYPQKRILAVFGPFLTGQARIFAEFTKIKRQFQGQQRCAAYS